MTMQPNPPGIFIYTALPCEAKPLIEHFRLKKDTTALPFAVYCNQDICLTVTGIGKNAMAAGVAYSQARMPHEDPVLLNVGIAGHKHHALGSLFLIDKITDFDSQRNYYPPLVFTPPCLTCGIQTVSIPQVNYSETELADMEASAFYETAVRFTSGELVQCLKVISDNQLSPVDYINPKQASALIAAHIPAIEELIRELGRLTALITRPEPKLFEELVQRYHFTVSEKLQLKNRLSRWAVITGQTELELDASSLHSGKDVLRRLDQLISKIDFYL